MSGASFSDTTLEVECERSLPTAPAAFSSISELALHDFLEITEQLREVQRGLSALNALHAQLIAQRIDACAVLRSMGISLDELNRLTNPNSAVAGDEPAQHSLL